MVDSIRLAAEGQGMNSYLQVAAGGAIGTTLRYAVTRAMPWHGPGFPIATFAINVAGCLVMGVLAAFLAHRGGQQWALFAMTGILGGFTTFSAFSLDALVLWQRGQAGLAATYVAGSVILSLLAVVAGMALGRAVFA